MFLTYYYYYYYCTSILVLAFSFLLCICCISFYSAPDRGADCWDARVCLSVCVCVSMCLSLRDHIFRTTHQIFIKFLCMLPMAVALSFSGGVVICCFDAVG